MFFDVQIYTPHHFLTDARKLMRTKIKRKTFRFSTWSTLWPTTSLFSYWIKQCAWFVPVTMRCDKCDWKSDKETAGTWRLWDGIGFGNDPKVSDSSKIAMKAAKFEPPYNITAYSNIQVIRMIFFVITKDEMFDAHTHTLLTCTRRIISRLGRSVHVDIGAKRDKQGPLLSDLHSFVQFSCTGLLGFKPSHSQSQLWRHSGDSDIWVCGWNPIVLPFKWNLFSSTFTCHFLYFSILQMKFGIPLEFWF